MLLMIYIFASMMYAFTPQTVSSSTYVIGNLIFEKRGFWNLGFPIVGTFSIYVATALLHGDPWHILTCSIQYILIIPSYIHIIMTHACNYTFIYLIQVCNLNDMLFKRNDSLYSTEISMPQLTPIDFPIPDDIDAQFLKAVNNLQIPDLGTSNTQIDRKDILAAFRTRLVVMWIVTNSLMCIIMTSDLLHGFNTPFIDSFISLPEYLKFIMYSIFGITSVRCVGTILFIASQIVFGWVIQNCIVWIDTNNNSSVFI